MEYKCLRQIRDYSVLRTGQRKFSLDYFWLVMFEIHSQIQDRAAHHSNTFRYDIWNHHQMNLLRRTPFA